MFVRLKRNVFQYNMEDIDEIKDILKIQCRILDKLRMETEKQRKVMEGHPSPIVRADPDVKEMFDDKEDKNNIPLDDRI